MAWLGGRFGGGKTTLAVETAQALLSTKRFRYVCSNIPVKFAVPFGSVVPRWHPPVDTMAGHWSVDTIVIMDEAGIFMRYRREVGNLLAFLRKLNIVVLMPSVLPPSRFVRFFRAQRVLNLSKLVPGFNWWVYRTRLTYDEVQERSWFVYRPDVFGKFNSFAYAVDDGGFDAAFRGWVETLGGVEMPEEDDDKNRAADLLDEAAGSLSDSAVALQAGTRRARGKR